MRRHLLLGLAGALVGAGAAAAVWWPSLWGLALALGDAPAVLRTARGLTAAAALPAVGLVNGAAVGAARGRLGGGAWLEAALSPFAWLMTAGEGMAGGLVMVLSLLPGACVGGLAGLWLAGTPVAVTHWPDEAVVGAIVGTAAGLAGLNLYVQWPTLRPPPEPAAGPPPDGSARQT